VRDQSMERMSSAISPPPASQSWTEAVELTDALRKT
jgi:hypothetical protein